MTDEEAARRGRRISSLFARYGEDVSLLRAGTSRTVRGLLAPLDSPVAGTYFDGNETVGLVRPALELFVDGQLSDLPLAGDVFTRDGRVWAVRKTQGFRMGNALLLLLALCD